MVIAWWSLSPGIVRHFEVRDGLLVMKMSSMLCPLVGVVTICSVWVVRSMSRKRLLMSMGYESMGYVLFFMLWKFMLVILKGL